MEENNNVNLELEPLVFTRYLYSKEEVERSLFLALLEHKWKEALFWGYELYYSGYQIYIMNFVMNIYNEIYATKNSTQFASFITGAFEEWLQDQSKDYLLGTMIWNMALREYCIQNFLEKYCEHKTIINQDYVVETPKKNIKIVLCQDDITDYTTIHDVPPYRILQRACKYAIHKEFQEFFITATPEYTEEYYNDWLYYSYSCPLWKQRIDEYDGIIVHMTKTVYIPKDKQDEFYENYDYQPDEQPKEVQEKSIGNGNINQLSIHDFISRYGKHLVSVIT
jgi:hypothetical protein